MGRNNKSRRAEKKRKATQKGRERRAGKLGQPPDRNVLVALEDGRAEYARTWSEGNARHYTAAGHYEWMASKLVGYSKVLEIGTGSGNSTLALVRERHLVVGVDENPACLALTEATLRRAGFDARVELRGEVHADDQGYKINYSSPTAVPFEVPATLMEGDLLNDRALLQWLEYVGPFDAVACWLVGTHKARGHNVAIRAFDFQGAHHYRLAVENSIYVLADRLLRSGGLLQVVDRGELPTEQFVADDVVDGHREQSRPTTLVVETMDSREYVDPVPEQSMRMTVITPLSGRTPDMTRTAFTSVLSRKP